MSPTPTLADLPIATDAVVQGFLGSKPSLTRLRELGLVPGTKVRVVRRALFGEPIEILLRGSSVAMRNSDAAFIEVNVSPIP